MPQSRFVFTVGPFSIPDLKRTSGSYDPTVFFNSFRQQADFVMTEEELVSAHLVFFRFLLMDCHTLVQKLHLLWPGPSRLARPSRSFRVIPRPRR